MTLSCIAPSRHARSVSRHSEADSLNGPTVADTHRGFSRLQQHRYDDAWRDFGRAAQAHGEFFQAQMAEGLGHLQQGRPLRAARHFFAATAASPKSGQPMELLVQALRTAAPHDPEGALQHPLVLAAMQLSGCYHGQHSAPATHAEALADAETPARSALSEAIEQGVVAFSKRNYTRAWRAFAQVGRMAPGFAAAQLTEAKRYLTQGQFMPAIPAAFAALAAAPSPDALTTLTDAMQRSAYPGFVKLVVCIIEQGPSVLADEKLMARLRNLRPAMVPKPPVSAVPTTPPASPMRSGSPASPRAAARAPAQPDDAPAPRARPDRWSFDPTLLLIVAAEGVANLVVPGAFMVSLARVGVMTGIAVAGRKLYDRMPARSPNRRRSPTT